MKLTLQDELYKRYLANIPAHDISGKAAMDAIIEARLYPKWPLRFLYLPKAFTEEGYQLVKDAGETMGRILCKVIHEYLGHEDYRALFGFEPALEEMILNRPYYDMLLPVCRLDIFLNEETGTFKYCEFNADGSSAMDENRVMDRIYRNTRICAELDQDYEQTSFELFDSWVSVFLGLYAQHHNARQRLGFDDPAVPTVAVVDFMDKKISSAEFEQFCLAFERAGCRAVIAEICDLTYENGHLYAPTPDGPLQIDAIYRRAVTSDILDHRDRVQPFLQAVHDKSVCLVGDFCTQVVHDKILFRILHLPRTREFLTADEVQYIEDHVPYTAILTTAHAAEARFTERPSQWILKPEDAYGAHEIYYGGNYTPEEWKALLVEHAAHGYILQEYVEPYRTLNADYTTTTFDFDSSPYQQAVPADAPPHVHSFANMTGMYLYCGQLSGIYSRLSPTNIISTEDDEHEMVSVVARPRK